MKFSSSVMSFRMPEIVSLPNRFRPGVGKSAHPETRRPLLPQMAVHCPVLGAGSGLGCLVYPALAEGEAFQIRYLPDNRYLFSFFEKTNSPTPVRVFSLRYTLSAPGAGQWTEEVIYQNPECGIDDIFIFKICDCLIFRAQLGRSNSRRSWIARS